MESNESAGAVPRTERDVIMERFKISMKRLPRYGRLATNMLRDDRTPVEARAALAAGAVYVLSPIDLIPGFIPVLGQLDDLLVALIGLRFALMQTAPEVRAEHLDRAGLAESDFADDLRTVRDTSIYLVRAGGRRVMTRGGRMVRRVEKRIGRGSGSGPDDLAGDRF